MKYPRTFCITSCQTLPALPCFHICFVCQVTAVDDDVDENRLYRYAIISVNPDAPMMEIGGFEMDVNTGTVCTTGRFDREVFGGPYSIAVSFKLPNPPSFLPLSLYPLTLSLPPSLFPPSLTLPTLPHYSPFPPSFLTPSLSLVTRFSPNLKLDGTLSSILMIKL